LSKHELHSLIEVRGCLVLMYSRASIVKPNWANSFQTHFLRCNPNLQYVIALKHLQSKEYCSHQAPAVNALLLLSTCWGRKLWCTCVDESFSYL